MISTLLAQFWPYIAGAIGVLASLFAVRQSGKSAAKADLLAAQMKQAQKAQTEANDVRDQVAHMGDDTVSNQLKSDWVRKP